MKALRNLTFKLKYRHDDDVEKLMKDKEDIRDEIKGLMKSRREIEKQIDKVLATREETKKKVNEQREMETVKKRKFLQAREKTEPGRKMEEEQDQRIEEENPGEEWENKEITAEVGSMTKLMAETIAEAKREAEVENIGSGGENTPLRADKASLFSNPVPVENKADSEKKEKDGKKKDEKIAGGFFGDDLLEELLNDDSLNIEEEQPILKFIGEASAEDIIKDLRYVKKQLIKTSS